MKGRKSLIYKLNIYIYKGRKETVSQKDEAMFIPFQKQLINILKLYVANPGVNLMFKSSFRTLDCESEKQSSGPRFNIN